MKTAALFTLVLVGALLMGCQTDPCKTDCCGELKANCCGWDFYKPCRMIRGVDGAAECENPCGTDPCGTRVVLTPCDTGAAEEAPEAAPMPEAPAAGEAAAEPVADLDPAEYGVAPTGR